jgi:catechol 2,3-dioxygenase-like lactoylglutathione lyase family enzyme
MRAHVTLVSVGVEDLSRALAFYGDGLGWRPSSASVEGDVAFFRLGSLALAIWSRAALAADAGLPDPGGWGGVALVHYVASMADVDAVIAAWTAAGGTVTRPAAEADWGGYAGYVSDPDGHPWEIAWNPTFHLADDGTISLPD